MIMWIQLCFYGYAWVMEMWILHLLARNYVSGEKPLDSYELWKCEHYGSGDKSGFNLSQIHCCMWEVFFYYWDIFQLPYLLNKQLVKNLILDSKVHLNLRIRSRGSIFGKEILLKLKCMSTKMCMCTQNIPQWCSFWYLTCIQLYQHHWSLVTSKVDNRMIQNF